jgi:hypothetical protein
MSLPKRADLSMLGLLVKVAGIVSRSGWFVRSCSRSSDCSLPWLLRLLQGEFRCRRVLLVVVGCMIEVDVWARFASGHYQGTASSC